MSAESTGAAKKRDASNTVRGSAIEYSVGDPELFRVTAGDGVSLATDVYLPTSNGGIADGAFPALLERTPYDKGRPFLVQTARYFARRGYAVVLQDVRGRNASAGEWEFLPPSEGPDGADTIAWITAQAWSNGRVGSMGLSYSTANQQALALENPPGLVAQILLDGGYSYFHRTLRYAGACELGVLLPYVLRLAGDSHELGEARRGFEAACGGLPDWLRELPLDFEKTPLRLTPRHQEWFLRDLRSADYGGHWKGEGINLMERVEAYPDLPVFIEASWYGHHVWASVEKFKALRARNRAPTRLLLGPWTHGYDDFARVWCGEVDFGSGAMLDNLNDLRLRWFDRWLKDLQTGIEEESPVRIFVMGGGSGRRNRDGRLEHGGRWRDESEFPLARTEWRKLYLQAGRGLSDEPPAKQTPPSRYRFDPVDPVPTVGAGVQAPLFPGLIQSGPYDQVCRSDIWACRDGRPLADRSDVLVFQTDPLTEPLEITGPIEVRLFVASSAPDTDFTAKLIDVYPPSDDYPRGFAMNLTDGIVRARYRDSLERPSSLAPGVVYEIVIEPQPVSNVFARGHRLRLDVSSSNFPRFDVNPNTGEPLGVGRRTVVADNEVFHDGERASHVVLPMIPG